MENFKLNALEAKELENVKGGYLTTSADCDGNWCGCGCYYANNGGSSTNGNYSANLSTGSFSGYRGDAVVIAPC
jgi:natural product precursor